MGCPHSTQSKLNSISPKPKSKKKLRVSTQSPSTNSEFRSPRTEDFHLLQEKAQTFETSPCHALETRFQLASSENLRSEGNKNRKESPSIHINGSGLFKNNSNLDANSNSVQADQDKNDKKSFNQNLFQLPHGKIAESNHKKLEVQQIKVEGTSTPDKIQSGENDLKKLHTFGGKQITSSEELDRSEKNLTKSNEEQKNRSGSIVFSRQDLPETPGFKPAGLVSETQIDYEAESRKGSYPVLPTFKIHRPDQEQEVSTPEPRIEQETRKCRNDLDSKERKTTERNVIIQIQQNLKEFDNHQLSLKKEQSQKSSETGKNSSSDKRSEPKDEKKEKLSFENKARKKFNQNLLDLVSPNFKKDPSLFLKNESTINGVVNEILYDSHGLSVLTPSLPHITSDNQKPREFYRENQIEAHFEPELEPVKSSGKRKHRKISPLKIHAVDFVHNGESISPINNSKIGNATPPFSNRTFYVKNFLGSGEINTVSYVENLSKGDFDKLSFSAEIKAQEIVDQNASIESINIRREVSKKSNFAPIQIKKLINQDSLYDLDQKKRKENNMWLFDLKEAGKSARPKTYLDVEDKELLTTNLEMKKANSTPFIGGEANLERKKRNSIQIIETSRLDKSINENGFKTINQYTILNELGRGSFAKVQLGVIWDDEDYKEYAIKVANKKKLKRKLFTKQKNAFTQIQAEIAMLKKTCHPNIIQLYEVIDNPEKDKLYLVMEYATKGAVMSKKYWSSEAIENQTDPDQDIRGRPLTIAKAKQYFRDLVRGLHYLHHHANIVHRDIKPENLLIDKNDTLKITDFNISHMFENTDVVCDSAGTKLYLSPEAWSGSSFRGKPADIWAAGVTLYYFLYGKVPFPPKIGQDIKDIILTKELEFPDNREIDPEAVNLIKACLDKDPTQRITVKELMKDPWITDNGANPLSNEEFGEVSVTLEEIRAALTVKIQTTFMVANQLVKSLNSARSNLQKTKREFDNSFGIS